MKSFLQLRPVERVLPIVLIANFPVWLFGALGLAMALEYKHWGGDTYLALALFAYLPIALLVGILSIFIRQSDRTKTMVLRFLFLWGLMTIATALIWFASVWLP